MHVHAAHGVFVTCLLFRTFVLQMCRPHVYRERDVGTEAPTLSCAHCSRSIDNLTKTNHEQLVTCQPARQRRRQSCCAGEAGPADGCRRRAASSRSRRRLEVFFIEQKGCRPRSSRVRRSWRRRSRVLSQSDVSGAVWFDVTLRVPHKMVDSAASE